MQHDKRWVIMPGQASAAQQLATQIGLTHITAQLLINRGVDDPNAARTFLHPTLNSLHNPSLMPYLDAAAERVRLAAERKERVTIYGDYDVDGITSTAILMRCIARLGVTPHYYIPDRLEEGYGLNAKSVRQIAEDGTRLLITVDCGITAVAEVALAHELGMDVIVTDHHEPGPVLPSGALLINPKLPRSSYPFRELCGAGLAFKLAWAIGKTFSSTERVSPRFRDFLVDLTSLAALGTIADVVPLQDENRALVHFGLKSLSSCGTPGLRALRDAANLDGETITASDVAFRIAPRLNAAGRLGCARCGVELLTTDSPEEAQEIVTHLDRENSKRQRLQERIRVDAEHMFEEAGGAEKNRSIVLASDQWHAGVVGVVASRLAERYWRPTLLLTIDGDEAHGSARSVGDLNLFLALSDCEELLLTFGGHSRAAGLRLNKANLATFKDRFEAIARANISEEETTPALQLDAAIRLPEITRSLLDEIGMLDPFGAGNTEPLFASFDLPPPTGVRRMGVKGRHMSFWANQNGTAFRAVAFGLGEMAEKLEHAGNFSMAFVPRLNRYRGTAKIELDVRDIKIGE